MSPDTESYFSPDYQTARRRFRHAAVRAGAALHTLDWGLKDPRGEKLGIDLAVFGRPTAKRVLLHSSGLHGVEGFAGSAIQIRVCERLPALPRDGAIVLAHILNPYGMAHLRRVNENNVDLNRNFLEEDAPGWREGASEGYRLLHGLLNPASPPTGLPLAFYARLVFRLWLSGWKRLQQAGAEGQFEYPRALFFGGRRREKGPALYLDFLREHLKSARHVCAIDVHTGLGERGEQLIILERNQGGDYHRHLTPLYADALDNTTPGNSAVYAVRGGIETGVPRVLPPRATVDFVTQEFGTVHGLKMLFVLREENRLAHYGKAHLLHPAKLALREAFCPQSTRWKRSILEKGERLFLDTARFLFA